MNRIITGGNGGESMKFDYFLFFGLILLTLGILVFNLAAGSISRSRRIELVLSEQWTATFERDTLNELIREFEDSHPLFRIRLTAQARTQGSQDADIVLLDDSRLGGMIQRNALYPLNSYMPGYSDTAPWAVPLVLSMDLLFYNIDLLQSAGFDHPPRTRDEFLRYSRVISSRGNGVYGFAPGLSPQDPLALKRDFFSWLWAAGFPLVTEGRPGIDPRTAADLLSFIGQLNSAGPAGDNPFEKTGEQRLLEFMQGKLAMVIAPAHVISRVRGQMGESNFGITVIPGAASPAKTRLGLSGFYAGINSRSARPDDAWTFLAFLAEKSPVLSQKITTVPGSLPGVFSSAETFPGEQIRRDSLYAKAWEIFETSDITETLSGLPQAVELEQIVFEELRAFLEQDRRPQDTAAAIQRRWDLLF